MAGARGRGRAGVPRGRGVKPFRYLRPASLDDAVAALRELGDGAQVIAGGQSLLLAMKARQATPTSLVSLAGVTDLRGLHRDEGELVLGATTTYADLERFTADTGPALRWIRAVVSNIADTAVRSMATIGGAACQAEPAFDVPTLLTACDATLTVVSAEGSRELAADGFFDGAGATQRRRDEVLRSIRIPCPKAARYGFAKFGLRAHDAALASVAVVVRASDGVVEDARVVIGGCVDRPTRAADSERWLQGQELSTAAPRFGAAVAEEVEPTISTTPFSSAYRRRLLAGLARRALVQAADQPDGVR